jgi:hypothetical protein
MNRKVMLAPMLALAILLSTSPLLLTMIGDGTGTVSYVICENNYIFNPSEPGKLSVVNSAGGRAVICQFTLPSFPFDVAFDSSGNYIVLEAKTLSKVTPDGVRTVIYTISTGFGYLAIDSSGNYIVTESGDLLAKVTPDGVNTEICHFPTGSYPMDLAIDSSGNYIVTEFSSNMLSKVTPDGVRTVIYNFSKGTNPNCVAIDSSGNYIVALWVGILAKVTPEGEMTEIYRFSGYPNTALCKVAIDSSGNYIVCEYNNRVLSKVTPAGERTVIYTFPVDTGNPNSVLISNAPELFFADVTENGLTATWTQSADPSFAGYQLYQSTTQGELGSLIGNTNVADTSLTVTSLSPWTTYYFTLRVLGANGAYVDYGQRSMTTAKAFWQETWFAQVMFVVAVVGFAAIAIYVVYSRSKKRAKVT